MVMPEILGVLPPRCTEYASAAAELGSLLTHVSSGRDWCWWPLNAANWMEQAPHC